MSTLTLDASAGAADPLAEAAPVQAPDTGLICLTMLARYHGLSADPEQIAHRFAEAGQAMRLPDLLHAARQLGLHGRVPTAASSCSRGSRAKARRCAPWCASP